MNWEDPDAYPGFAPIGHSPFPTMAPSQIVMWNRILQSLEPDSVVPNSPTLSFIVEREKRRRDAKINALAALYRRLKQSGKTAFEGNGGL